MKAERNSNIELLRIISMIMIVLSHFSVHSHFEFDNNSFSLNQVFTQTTVLGNVGVNVFVLISSYFLSSGGGTRHYKRLFSLWRSMFLYSVLIYLIIISIGNTGFEALTFIKSFFPITFEIWWFATTYVMLVLLHPFINAFLSKLDITKHLSLIVLCFIVWVIVPTFTDQRLKCNDLLWFITLYVFVGYIRRIDSSISRGSRFYFAVAGAIYILYCLSVVILDLLNVYIPAIGNHATYFSDKQRVIMAPLSACLFVAFLKMKPRFSLKINIIAKCMFGIYLISENPYIRDVIWTDINPLHPYTESCWFIPYSLIYIIAVFVFCLGIEFVRIVLIEKTMNNSFMKIEDKIYEFFRKKAVLVLTWLQNINL